MENISLFKLHRGCGYTRIIITRYWRHSKDKLIFAEHVQLERNINVALLTVSDTRDFDSDKGGQLVQSLLKEINVSIEEHHYKIVKDDKMQLHYR